MRVARNILAGMGMICIVAGSGTAWGWPFSLLTAGILMAALGFVGMIVAFKMERKGSKR